MTTAAQHPVGEVELHRRLLTPEGRFVLNDGDVRRRRLIIFTCYVLRRMGQGMTVSKIARELGTTPTAINNRTTRFSQAVGAQNRTHLFALMLKMGFITVAELSIVPPTPDEELDD